MIDDMRAKAEEWAVVLDEWMEHQYADALFTEREAPLEDVERVKGLPQMRELHAYLTALLQREDEPSKPEDVEPVVSDRMEEIVQLVEREVSARTNTPEDGVSGYGHFVAICCEFGLERPTCSPQGERDHRAMELYRDLLYGVVNKVPGETRHETAKRIIRQHETPSNDPEVTDVPKVDGVIE